MHLHPSRGPVPFPMEDCLYLFLLLALACQAHVHWDIWCDPLSGPPVRVFDSVLPPRRRQGDRSSPKGQHHPQEKAALICSFKLCQHHPAGATSQGKGIMTQNWDIWCDLLGDLWSVLSVQEKNSSSLLCGGLPRSVPPSPAGGKGARSILSCELWNAALWEPLKMWL